MNENNRIALIAANTGRVRRDPLEGNRFGRLVVLSCAGRDKNNNSLWDCKCDCGKRTTTRGFMLRSGRAKSCGCYHTDDLVRRQTKERITVQEKKCPSCGEIKISGMFGKDSSRPDGLNSQCKHCKNVEYKRKNKGSVNHSHAMRKIKVKQATPEWVNLKDIEAIYIAASKKTKESGISHHVDHIMPISHPLLCGLNIPLNLQILSGTENCSKGNRIFTYQTP